MNKKDLKKYLLKVAKEGYATNDENAWKKEADGSTTITHSDGPWNMNDNFFGGEPYGGREVIFYEGKPVWIMVYYGKVMQEVTEVGKVYAFLQKALAQTDQNCPLRGPKVLKEGEFLYKNDWMGGIESFSGSETIYRNDKGVYFAQYMGGIVDQRGEN